MGTEKSEFWDSLYKCHGKGGGAQSPFTREMHEKIKSIIPDDVRTILDAGCGTGSLMAYLEEYPRFDVQGMDLSAEGVGLVVNDLKMKAQVGNVLDMHQFQDASFDLVICSEVIEHLKLSEVPLCIGELLRVAGNYLIITTPYREALRYHLVACNLCQTQFHPAGHINSVDEEFFRKNLAGQNGKVRFHYSGKREWRWNWYADLMRSRGYNILQIKGVNCPVCGNSIDYKKWGLAARLAGRGYRSLQLLLRRLGVHDHANIITFVEVRRG